MEKSRVDQVKDFVFYAPLGVLKVVKSNASTVFSLIVNQGKTVTDSSQTPQSGTIHFDDVHPEDSRIKSRARAGVRDVLSDVRKQQSLAQTALGSLSFMKDNAKTFSTTFQERGKKEMDDAVGKAKEKIPKKTTEGISEEGSPSIVESTTHLASQAVGGVVTVGAKAANFSFSLVKKGADIAKQGFETVTHSSTNQTHKSGDPSAK